MHSAQSHSGELAERAKPGRVGDPVRELTIRREALPVPRRGGEEAPVAERDSFGDVRRRPLRIGGVEWNFFEMKRRHRGGGIAKRHPITDELRENLGDVYRRNEGSRQNGTK